MHEIRPVVTSETSTTFTHTSTVTSTFTTSVTLPSLELVAHLVPLTVPFGGNLTVVVEVYNPLNVGAPAGYYFLMVSASWNKGDTSNIFELRMLVNCYRQLDTSQSC